MNHSAHEEELAVDCSDRFLDIPIVKSLLV